MQPTPSDTERKHFAARISEADAPMRRIGALAAPGSGRTRRLRQQGFRHRRYPQTPAARTGLTVKAILRFSLLCAIGFGYLVAIVEHPKPLVIAVGLAPIVWLALEAAWHLTKRIDRS